MSRVLVTSSKVFVIASAVGALAAVSLIGAPAAAQWVPPPPEVVATLDPVYYEGHAAYWYGNHWYWRDEHGGWNHYDNEPAFLADHRAHFPPVRHSYTRPAEHGAEHGAEHPAASPERGGRR
jgi:hypothetical protein